MPELKKPTKVRNQYFPKEVQDAIVAYNTAQDATVRNYYYSKFIHKPFNKLSEIIIRRFKFYHWDVDTIGEVKHEIEIKLLDSLHKYDPSKGKAYSYFTKIVKNYLIWYDGENKRKFNAQLELESVDDYAEHQIENIYEEQSKNYSWYIDHFLVECDRSLEAEFSEPEQVRDLRYLIQLVRDRETFNIGSIDSLYMYLRQFTDISSSDMKFYLRWIRQRYIESLKKYDNGEYFG